MLYLRSRGRREGEKKRRSKSRETKSRGRESRGEVVLLVVLVVGSRSKGFIGTNVTPFKRDFDFDGL